MNSDIVDLRSFYSSLIGRLAERAIAMALSPIWADLPNERLVGLGYALPWLDRFGGDAERVFAFMPGTQGAVSWPPGGPSATAMVFDEELPLPDSAIDRILLVHLLEHSENPRETLKEAWRVLAPGGRVVMTMINPLLGDIGHAIWWYSEDKQRGGMLPGEVGGMWTRDIVALCAAVGLRLETHRRFVYGMNHLYVFVDAATN